MDWTNWVREALCALRETRIINGKRGVSPGDESDLGKRQTVFENSAVRIIRELLPPNTALEAEGYQIVNPATGDIRWIVEFDPTDGTAGDVRSRGVNCFGSDNGLPVSCVLSVRENVPNPTFASVKHSGILSLHDWHIFWASDDGAFLETGTINNRSGLRLVGIPQYNLHAPAIACEVTRRANAFLRFLVPYGVYPEVFADSHSSAVIMLWSLLGYCDLYWNANLPNVAGAGQRGHELGAIAVFARAMKSYAVQTAIEGNQIVFAGDLDNAPYTFDGQTSVILGVDEHIVHHYLDLVNSGLASKVKFKVPGQTLKLNFPKGGQEITLTVGDVIAELYRQYPNRQWSLPLVRHTPSV